MNRIPHWGLLLAATLPIAPLPASAADLTVPMTLVTAKGTSDSVGTIVIGQDAGGVVLKLHLTKLPPGSHGFHVHENGDCGPTMTNGTAIPAGAAGRHFDPGQTGHHAGPTGDGHLGDLPLLAVEANGTASQTLTAPRIKSIDQLHGKAIVIHANGDNYADVPEPLGGGGGRIACGVIP